MLNYIFVKYKFKFIFLILFLVWIEFLNYYQYFHK
jgi:hypothetical protein